MISSMPRVLPRWRGARIAWNCRPTSSPAIVVDFATGGKDYRRCGCHAGRRDRTPRLRAMETVVALVVAYLVGSIDFGVIVPRVMGIDIYEHGSGNPGTSNVFRTLGKKAAAVVLLGDALKGIAAVGLAAAIGDSEATTHAAAVTAVLGHVLPIWHGFKGGRGVATAIGAAIWLEPWFGLGLAVVWAVVVIVTKTASIASLGAMALFVPGFAIAGTRGWSLLWVAVVSVIVIARHSGNIQRIIRRSERTVTES